MFRLIKGEDDGHGALAQGKVDKRAKKLPDVQIQQWADFYLNECGKSLLSYTHQGDPIHLAEAEEAVVALAVLVKELRSRRA